MVAGINPLAHSAAIADGKGVNRHCLGKKN